MKILSADYAIFKKPGYNDHSYKGEAEYMIRKELAYLFFIAASISISLNAQEWTFSTYKIGNDPIQYACIMSDNRIFSFLIAEYNELFGISNDPLLIIDGDRVLKLKMNTEGYHKPIQSNDPDLFKKYAKILQNNETNRKTLSAISSSVDWKNVLKLAIHMNEDIFKNKFFVPLNVRVNSQNYPEISFHGADDSGWQIFNDESDSLTNLNTIKKITGYTKPICIRLQSHGSRNFYKAENITIEYMYNNTILRDSFNFLQSWNPKQNQPEHISESSSVTYLHAVPKTDGTWTNGAYFEDSWTLSDLRKSSLLRLNFIPANIFYEHTEKPFEKPIWTLEIDKEIDPQYIHTVKKYDSLSDYEMQEYQVKLNYSIHLVNGKEIHDTGVFTLASLSQLDLTNMISRPSPFSKKRTIIKIDQLNWSDSKQCTILNYPISEIQGIAFTFLSSDTKSYEFNNFKNIDSRLRLRPRQPTLPVNTKWERCYFIKMNNNGIILNHRLKWNEKDIQATDDLNVYLIGAQLPFDQEGNNYKLVISTERPLKYGSITSVWPGEKNSELSILTGLPEAPEGDPHREYFIAIKLDYIFDETHHIEDWKYVSIQEVNRGGWFEPDHDECQIPTDISSILPEDFNKLKSINLSICINKEDIPMIVTYHFSQFEDLPVIYQNTRKYFHELMNYFNNPIVK